MKVGIYRIKQQIDNYGFFGEIGIEMVESASNEVVFSPDVIPNSTRDDYSSAIKFGFNYGIRQYNLLKDSDKKYSIKVTLLNVFPIDSTPTVLVFVAARTVYNALGVDLEYPKLGRTNGEIIFEK